MKKVCTNCKEEKLLTDFSKRAKSEKKQSWCKSCAYNPERSWAYRLRKNYGLSSDMYYELLENQKGVCKICGGGQTRSLSKKLDVDHCHVTGKIRGLLCNLCNTAIGKLQDNPELLRKAATYLEQEGLTPDTGPSEPIMNNSSAAVGF